MANDEYRYKMRYRIECPEGGITKAQAKKDQEEGWGACDAFLIHSILYPPDGSLSIMTTGVDGRGATTLENTHDLADTERFKCWALLAHELMASEELSEGKRELCRLVHEAVKQAVLAGRQQD